MTIPTSSSKPALTADLANQLAMDTQSVGRLRGLAAKDKKAATKEAAQQFEAMMLNIMMKSMREAGAAAEGEDPLDSEQTKMFRGMLDQQLTQKLAAGKGVGLAQMLVKQLDPAEQAKARKGVEAPPPKTALGTTQSSEYSDALAALVARRAENAKAQTERVQQYLDVARLGGASGTGTGRLPANAAAFVKEVGPHAEEAARILGVSPHLVIAHAALESSWGKRPIVDRNGQTTYNLFGIKAGAKWKGPVAEVLTTEFINGQYVKKYEKFRAYSSYAEGFTDYAKFLSANPRYAQVLGNGADSSAFAKALQKAGYATDPNYASKLMKVAGSQHLDPIRSDG